MADELVKQPSESRLYDFDFTELLESAETISSINSTTLVNLGKVSGSSDITLGTPVLGSKIVQIRITDGTDKENYKITVNITTSLSNILELEGILRIRNL